MRVQDLMKAQWFAFRRLKFLAFAGNVVDATVPENNKSFRQGKHCPRFSLPLSSRHVAPAV
jgi:hypothetical protein